MKPKRKWYISFAYLKEKSEEHRRFYLSTLALALFKIPIATDSKIPISSLHWQHELSLDISELDVIVAASIVGFHMKSVGDATLLVRFHQFSSKIYPLLFFL